MALVKKYKNVLTGAFTNGQVRKSLIVPCRGARMVVARASSASANLVGTPAFILYSSDAEGSTEHSAPGQGYVQAGTMPITLNHGPAVCSISCVPSSASGGGIQLFFHDWIAIQITATASGHASDFALDIEVWYENDADQMLLEQLNTSSYTPS